MKKVLIMIFAVVLVSVSVTSISAQSSYEIPSWVKGIAGFWAQGNISDEEFGEGLSFLIDSGVISIPRITELEQRVTELENENKKLRGETVTSNPSTNTMISVFTDDTHYVEGDTIVISGSVAEIVGSTPMTLHIFLDGNLVDIAQVTVAQDGSYSHTVIAEGPLWYDGLYVVRAPYGEGNTVETKFSVTAKTVVETTGKIRVDARNYGVFDVNYGIRGGMVSDITFDSELYGLIVEIDSTDEGTVTFDLHENLIRAERHNGSQDTFVVLIDGIEVAYSEIPTTSDYRKISVNFEQGDSEILILGTFVYTPNQSTSSYKAPSQNCDASYPDVCIAPYPPDLNCGDVPYVNFRVIGSDPHGFDRDRDGVGCEK